MRRPAPVLAVLTLVAALTGCGAGSSSGAARGDGATASSSPETSPAAPTAPTTGAASSAAEPLVGASAKTIGGDVVGADGRAVDVFMGIELKDAAGRNIKLDGRPVTQGGYVATLRVNQDLDALGSEDVDEWETSWSLTVPANAQMMFLEVYPRNAGKYGTTNDIRYGRVLRRFRVATSLDDVHVELPVRCSQGGNTGTIAGVTKVGGVPRQVSRISAFSLGADNNDANPILGFSIGTSNANGSFKLSGLAPGTKYRVFAVARPGVPQKTADVTVRSCATSTVNFAF